MSSLTPMPPRPFHASLAATTVALAATSGASSPLHSRRTSCSTERDPRHAKGRDARASAASHRGDGETTRCLLIHILGIRQLSLSAGGFRGEPPGTLSLGGHTQGRGRVGEPSAQMIRPQRFHLHVSFCQWLIHCKSGTVCPGWNWDHGIEKLHNHDPFWPSMDHEYKLQDLDGRLCT